MRREGIDSPTGVSHRKRKLAPFRPGRGWWYDTTRKWVTREEGPVDGKPG
jgi:hypothetical protein